MTEAEAVVIANSFVQAIMNAKPLWLGERYQYSFLKTRFRSSDNLWSVVYTIILPDEPNAVVDGPVIVFVDPTTHTARFLI